MRCNRSAFRIGSALALVLVLAGCTKGGQFDPTEVFSSDMFDTKKKLQGQREDVFPNGVPGTTSGIPPDLVKGYQAPVDQSADTGADAAPPPEAQAKPKPKPRPKVARAPAPPRAQITVGRPSSASPQGSASQSVWPAAPSAAPQQTAQPAQSVWPNPPTASQ
jgi:hypothetical protein